MYENEIASRTCRTSFYNCLKNSAKQLYLVDGDKEFMLSGYPWGTVLARNTFMSLPGNTLAIGHRQDFENIMDTASKALITFMESGGKNARIHGIDLPDIPLWALWAIQQYAKMEGMEAARKIYTPLVAGILQYLLDGRHPNLFVLDNGLISTEGSHVPASWMNS